MTNRRFILNLLGILAFLLFVIFATISWLRIYTHHGEKIEVPSYVDTHISDARHDAERKSFQLIVNDSVHIVGEPGGIIQNQNPKGGAEVKKNRKIYVMTTKYQADQVDLASVYPLWGQDYDTKLKQLQQLAIACEIKEYRYDLTNGTILEIWHNGKKIIDRQMNPESYKIDRGSKLQMVVSSPQGGAHIVPNLVGKTVSESRFVLQTERLTLGAITYANDLGVDNEDAAIIVSQTPPADGTTTLPTGTPVNVTVKSGGGN